MDADTKGRRFRIGEKSARAEGAASSRLRNGGEVRRPAVEEEPGKFGDTDHFLFAGAARGNANRRRCWPRAEKNGRTGEHADAFPVAEGGGVAKSVIADGAQAARQNMAQVALHKLLSCDGFGFEAVVRAILGEKSDAVTVNGNHSLVADDAAGDIGAQISKGMGSGSDRFDMNTPILGPDRGINLPALGGNQTAKVVVERGLEELQVDEVGGIFDADDFAFGVDAGPRNKQVQVRMKLHPLENNASSEPCATSRLMLYPLRGYHPRSSSGVTDERRWTKKKLPPQGRLCRLSA